MRKFLKRAIFKKQRLGIFTVIPGFKGLRKNLGYLTLKASYISRSITRFRRIYTKKMRKLFLTTALRRFTPLPLLKTISKKANTPSCFFFLPVFRKRAYFYVLVQVPRNRLSFKDLYFSNSRLDKLLTKKALLLKNKRIKSYVFSFMKLPTIFNKFYTTFIGTHFNFLYTTNSFFLNYASRKVKKLYVIKKIMHTFATKYELHRYILKKYVKNRTTSLVHAHSTRHLPKFRSLNFLKFTEADSPTQVINGFLPTYSLFASINGLRTFLHQSFNAKN
jgi:hypothetical protein